MGERIERYWKRLSPWVVQYVTLIVVWELGVRFLAAPVARGMENFLWSVAGGDLNWYITMDLAGLFIVQSVVVITLSLLCWRLLLRRSFERLGYGGNQMEHELGTGLVLGLILACMAAAGLAGLGCYTIKPADFLRQIPMMLLYVLAMGLVAVSEETAFRGYWLSGIREASRPWIALVISSVLFGMIHSTNSGFSLLGLLNITLLGMIMGFLFWKTGSLWMSMGFHFSWNYVQGCILGLKVSGFSLPSAFESTITGPEHLSGGAFGLEGSVVTTAVCLVLLVGLWLFFRKKEMTSDGSN